MPLVNDDPLTQIAFSIYENKGVFALLLGSGLSRAAEIPTGWEITLDLVRRVAIAKGVPVQADWAAWHRAQVGGEPDYSALLEELATTPAERRAILEGYIEPTAEERERGAKVPTAAHRAVAQLVADGYLKVIVTTNFDRLMENALREAGVEPVVVASSDALAGAQPLAHAACYILKVHGDYKDDRILNTDEELATYPTTYNTLLDRIFDEYGLIVCGWSGIWDRALRGAILRAPNRRYTMYWATRGAVAAQSQDLIDHRRAKTISITSADNFFQGVAERVVTLEATRAQNHLSIDMLVSTAKRYLAKPEYRIALSDLVSIEVKKVVRFIKDQDNNIQRPLTAEEIRLGAAQYEAICEPLVRLAGAIGRWGDGSDLNLMQNALRALVTTGQTMLGGIVIWIEMRMYPALLLFTGYGLGLTCAERWREFHETMFIVIDDRQRQEKNRLVDAVFLKVSPSNDHKIWQSIEGLERHKAPLSAHLFNLFRRWSDGIDGASIDYLRLFAQYEAVCSLAVYEGNDESEMVAALERIRTNLHSGYQGLWMPISRLTWDNDAFRAVAEDLKSGKLRDELVQSGFARKNPSEIDFFLQNLAHLQAYMRWR